MFSHSEGRVEEVFPSVTGHGVPQKLPIQFLIETGDLQFYEVTALRWVTAGPEVPRLRVDGVELTYRRLDVVSRFKPVTGNTFWEVEERRVQNDGTPKFGSAQGKLAFQLYHHLMNSRWTEAVAFFHIQQRGLVTPDELQRVWMQYVEKGEAFELGITPAMARERKDYSLVQMPRINGIGLKVVFDGQSEVRGIAGEQRPDGDQE